MTLFEMLCSAKRRLPSHMVLSINIHSQAIDLELFDISEGVTVDLEDYGIDVDDQLITQIEKAVEVARAW